MINIKLLSIRELSDKLIYLLEYPTEGGGAGEEGGEGGGDDGEGGGEGGEGGGDGGEGGGEGLSCPGGYNTNCNNGVCTVTCSGGGGGGGNNNNNNNNNGRKRRRKRSTGELCPTSGDKSFI